MVIETEMARLDNKTANAEPNFEYILALYRRARSHWKLLPLVTMVILVISFVIFLIWPRSYTASATLVPGSSLGSTESSGNAGSALSALAGRSLLSSSTVSPFDMYISILDSKRLANRLAEKDSFLQIIFWPRWDSVNNRWKPANSGRLHAIGSFVKPIFGLVQKDHPDADDLAPFLSKHLVIATKESTTSPLSSITRVSFEFGDPQLTQQLLRIILTEADSILRANRRDDVRSRIAYLNKALQTTALADQHEALTNILSAQEEEYTVLEADKFYAITLLDPPNVSPVPSSPSPILFFGGAVFSSLLIWFGLIFFLPEDRAASLRHDDCLDEPADNRLNIRSRANGVT